MAASDALVWPDSEADGWDAPVAKKKDSRVLSGRGGGESSLSSLSGAHKITVTESSHIHTLTQTHLRVLCDRKRSPQNHTQPSHRAKWSRVKAQLPQNQLVLKKQKKNKNPVPSSEFGSDMKRLYPWKYTA